MLSSRIFDFKVSPPSEVDPFVVFWGAGSKDPFPTAQTSVLINAILSYGRYIAVCKSLRYSTLITTKKVRAVLSLCTVIITLGHNSCIKSPTGHRKFNPNSYHQTASQTNIVAVTKRSQNNYPYITTKLRHTIYMHERSLT